MGAMKAGESGHSKSGPVKGTDGAERKPTEAALRESEEKFRNIFENAPIGIFQTTLDGRFLTVNSAVARMLRYDSPGEILAAISDISKQLFLHPEQRSDILRRALESRTFVQQEVEYRCKDGSVFIANLHLRILRNNNDEAVSAEGFAEDITGRKLKEAE